MTPQKRAVSVALSLAARAWDCDDTGGFTDTMPADQMRLTIVEAVLHQRLPLIDVQSLADAYAEDFRAQGAAATDAWIRTTPRIWVPWPQCLMEAVLDIGPAGSMPCLAVVSREGELSVRDPAHPDQDTGIETGGSVVMHHYVIWRGRVVGPTARTILPLSPEHGPIVREIGGHAGALTSLESARPPKRGADFADYYALHMESVCARALGVLCSHGASLAGASNRAGPVHPMRERDMASLPWMTRQEIVVRGEPISRRHSQDGPGGGVPMHVRRGHFRACNNLFGRLGPRVIWIPETIVGDPSLGVRIRDYRITEP